MASDTNTFDVLIVGGGPAALTAGLTLARQLCSVVLFDSGKYRNGSAISMHMVPGWDDKNPAEFRASARNELTSNYKTTKIEDTEIIRATKHEQKGEFEVEDTKGGKWTGKKLILALGSSDIYPDIPGYSECWTKGM